jgi:hypothetical protein
MYSKQPQRFSGEAVFFLIATNIFIFQAKIHLSLFCPHAFFGEGARLDNICAIETRANV